VVKKGKRIERIEVRLNPAASHIDALLLAKIDKLPIAAPTLIKTLLLNHFALQPGGIGLDQSEMENLAELYPRSAKKASKPIVPPIQKEKVLVTAPQSTETYVKATSQQQTPSTEKWSKDRLPPCMDTSGLADF